MYRVVVVQMYVFSITEAYAPMSCGKYHKQSNLFLSEKSLFIVLYRCYTIPILISEWFIVTAASSLNGQKDSIYSLGLNSMGTVLISGSTEKVQNPLLKMSICI